MKIFRGLVRILFPRHCAGCKTEDHFGFCQDCAYKLNLTTNDPKNFVISAFNYKDPHVREIIWNLKYKNNKEILSNLSPLINDVLIQELEDRHVFNNFKEPILVPIPLFPTRKKKRGFNQAEVIAQNILEENQKLFSINTENLIRVVDTIPQAKIKNRINRQKNMIGAFEVVDPDVFHNRNIILVDDVTTTGATLFEAKKVLKEAGARNVLAFTLAR